MTKNIILRKLDVIILHQMLFNSFYLSKPHYLLVLHRLNHLQLNRIYFIKYYLVNQYILVKSYLNFFKTNKKEKIKISFIVSQFELRVN